jgi:maltose alpha-D-glucosyltransferase / alpha-amylase
MVRRRFKAFGRGTFEPLHPQNKSVLVFLREYEGETLLCVNNLSRYSQYVELDLARFAGKTLYDVWSNKAFPTIGELPYLLTMGPHGVYWFLISDTPPSEPSRQ